jgi:hypothetical protein
MVSSGKLGIVKFLIVPNNPRHHVTHDTQFDVTITTPTEILETKCNCWKAAWEVIERIAKQNERRKDEIDRDY